ncbi:MAG: hypothetical protein ABFS37_00830 [Acidobacteriota bacterium]
MSMTRTLIGLVMLVAAVSPAAVFAEDPPPGSSASEWRQLMGVVELTREGLVAGSDPDTKHVESLYSLEQKIGPEQSGISQALFGYDVALDGDQAVILSNNRVYVFVNGTSGWELEADFESFDPSVFFRHSIVILGDFIVVGNPDRCLGDFGPPCPGAARVYQRGSPGVWQYLQSLQSYVHHTDAQDAEFGFSLALTDDTLVIGAPGDFDLGVEPEEAGAAYVYTLVSGSWVFQQRLTEAFPGLEEHFGSSVALFGDTLVVGAPGDQVLFSPEAGRACVFDRSGSTWTQTTELTASDPASGDHFGTSVSIVPPTILVGAPDDDHAADADAGSVYEFTENGGAWSQSQKIVALDGEADDRFGAAVALGWGVAVIGAPDDNNGAFDIDAGSAYVFIPIGGTWFQDQKLFAPEGEMSDHFGFSVAVWGSTVLVGAPMDDVWNAEDTGSAYFFADSGTTWDHELTVFVRPPAVQDAEFGRSVAVDGDTMAVVRSGGYWGKVEVFVQNAGNWEMQQRISPSDCGWTTDEFGASVALSGDTLLVGVPLGDTQTVDDTGIVCVFVRTIAFPTPKWELEQVLWASDEVAHQDFGRSVAVDGDVAAVGSPGWDDSMANDAGAVYLFSRSGSFWTEDQILPSDDPEPGDELGWSLALSGDRLAVGTPQDDGGAVNGGAIHVFRDTSGSWTQEQKLLAGAPQTSGFLGTSVALDGSTVIGGAPGAEVGGHSNAGAAHVFVESGGVWSEQQQLSAASPATDNFLGQAISLSGDTAIVGAPGWDFHPYAQVGSALVFFRTASTWSQHQRLVSDVPQTDAEFGVAVSASADGILVAAPREDFTETGLGVVYWYEGGIDEADLSIAMDDGVTEVVPGAPVSYLIVVTNAGPSGAMGATVADVFPPELLGCSWTCEDFSGALCTQGPVAGDLDDTVDLPVGGRLEYTADCLLAPSATGDLVNTANVTAPPGVADPNPANNLATDIDTITPEADLNIDKDNGVTVLIEGQITTYTITVANAGPSDAPGSTVTDVFPVELSGCTWACTPGAGATCTASGAGDLTDLADLSAGSGVIYSATCTVAASSGQCSNTAEVAAAAGIVDPDPLNNDAADSDEIIGLADVIFVDGFESGDTSAWSDVGS